MALTLQEIYNARFLPTANSDLRQRLVGAIVKVAVQVVKEDPATANHAARLVWANAVIDTGEATLKYAEKFMWIFITHNDVVTDGLGITDAKIVNIVQNNFEQVSA